MKIEKKQLSRWSLVQIGIIVGQMTHAQPANISGKGKSMLVDEEIFNSWIKLLKEILEKEI